MSGVYGYPPYGAQPSGPAVSRLVAAALLTVGAALAIGGSFGVFRSFRIESAGTGARTLTTTGWGVTEDPVSDIVVPGTASVLHGIPLTVAAVVAPVAALLLVLSARRPGDPAPGRLLGVGAAGLLAGIVAVIWMELTTFVRNISAADEAGPGSTLRASGQIGAGGYLILVAAVAGLVAAALLLVPRRDVGPAPVQPGWFPPLGPGQPPWSGGPPPGPVGPGWGPPPPAGWPPQG
jgi:hypothetical protein